MKSLASGIVTDGKSVDIWKLHSNNSQHGCYSYVDKVVPVCECKS